MPRGLAFVPLERMPQVPGLAIPEEVYWILSGPAPLLGMVRPAPTAPWGILRRLGVRRVVCLIDEAPAYDAAPLSIAYAGELQDLFGGIDPVSPDAERAKIEAAAAAVVDALRCGHGVVVHCAGGTGRTGTVLGASLVALGVPAADVIAHLQAVNRLRGRSWPESLWQQEFLLRR